MYSTNSCCSVLSCSNRYRKKKEKKHLNFYRFPLKKPELLKKWRDAIRRNQWMPKSNSYICSDHFTEDDYESVTFEDGKKQLKMEAVPSVFARNWPHPNLKTKNGVKELLCLRTDLSHDHCYSKKNSILEDILSGIPPLNISHQMFNADPEEIVTQNKVVLQNKVATQNKFVSRNLDVRDRNSNIVEAESVNDSDDAGDENEVYNAIECGIKNTNDNIETVMVVCCRLCDKLISTASGSPLFNHEKNKKTRLGHKVQVILNPLDENVKLSNYCCQECCSKVQVCFSLLIEIKASDEAIRQTYTHLCQGKGLDISERYFSCRQCNKPVLGVKNFIMHNEQHVFEQLEFNQNIEENNTAGAVYVQPLETPAEQSLDNSVAINVEISEEEVICGETSTNLSDISESTDTESQESDGEYQTLVKVVKKVLNSVEDDEEDVDLPMDENGNFKCKSCDINFDYKFLLIQHRKAKHNVPGKAILTKNKRLLHPCRYCYENLTTKVLWKHVPKCKSKFLNSNAEVMCHKCGRMYLSTKWHRHEKTHMQSVHGYSCATCGRKFKKKSVLKSHLGEHDESLKRICEICGKKLLQRSFRTHMYKHESKKHQCDLCGKRFTFNYNLQEHLKIHKKNRIYGLKTEIVRKGKCHICAVKFDNVEDFQEHLLKEHEGITRAHCKVCNKNFRDMFMLRSHLKLIHNVIGDELTMYKSFPLYKDFVCDICQTMVNSERKLEAHMKNEHGISPVQVDVLKRDCEKCGKTFSSKQALHNHINAIHLNIKPVVCKICNERFTKYASLIVHRMKHTGEKPYQCEYCRKTYRQQGDVFRHLARHVRDGELKLEEASAVNTRDSEKVRKRRIFLKDSNIKQQNQTKRKIRRVKIERFSKIEGEDDEEQSEEIEEHMDTFMVDVEGYVKKEIKREENEDAIYQEEENEDAAYQEEENEDAAYQGEENEEAVYEGEENEEAFYQDEENEDAVYQDQENDGAVCLEEENQEAMAKQEDLNKRRTFKRIYLGESPAYQRKTSTLQVIRLPLQTGKSVRKMFVLRKV